ncbi:hypothetical protein F4694_002356 [Bacillus niacini]|jgi:hypothetical protein|uniref:Uncharacterized protein n=1 Tax=Neobacillus niacini TaxID=86668 RepID=A0A852TA19_9BACI|nr:hypothetical protein [Neobacillus niacini]NYE05603.1 hypothetical protein [Neobacillus niacini]
MVIVEEGKKVQTKTDLQYEGKDQVYLDIDRIINEGLSGGSVHARPDTTNIEEARNLTEEEPPSNVNE